MSQVLVLLALIPFRTLKPLRMQNGGMKQKIKCLLNLHSCQGPASWHMPDISAQKPSLGYIVWTVNIKPPQLLARRRNNYSRGSEYEVVRWETYLCTPPIVSTKRRPTFWHCNITSPFKNLLDDSQACPGIHIAHKLQVEHDYANHLEIT